MPSWAATSSASSGCARPREDHQVLLGGLLQSAHAASLLGRGTAGKVVRGRYALVSPTLVVARTPGSSRSLALAPDSAASACDVPGALALHPAGQVALRAARDGQRSRRHVAAYDGAAAGRGAVADLDRGDERVVGAAPEPAADDRCGAWRPRRSWRRSCRRRCWRARRSRRRRRTTGAAPWRRRRSAAFLVSTKVPILPSAPSSGAGSQVGERPDARARHR